MSGNELDRMTAEGELTVEQADLVIPAMIEGFVLSPVASRMAQAALRGGSLPGEAVCHAV